MKQKKILIGLIIGCLFLGGTASAMAALWDESCRKAIDNLQQIQKKVALKKHEIDTARMVEAIPSNFLSGELEATLRPQNGRSQAVRDLNTLFQNGEFAVQEFSQTCLKMNRVPQ